MPSSKGTFLDFPSFIKFHSEYNTTFLLLKIVSTSMEIILESSEKWEKSCPHHRFIIEIK